MSNKYECPGCKSYTSRIYDVFEGEYAACNVCGLSGEAMREIHRVREGHASEQVKARFEEMAVRTAKAEAKAAGLERKLNRLREFVQGFNWDGTESGDGFDEW